MNAFKFRLTTLLDTRRRQEDEFERTWSAALRVEQNAEGECLRLEAERAAWQRKWREATLTVDSINDFSAYDTELVRQSERAQVALDKAAAVRRQAMERLREARQKVRVLEKLKDRKQAEHAHEEARVEENLLEDCMRHRASMMKDDAKAALELGQPTFPYLPQELSA